MLVVEAGLERRLTKTARFSVLYSGELSARDQDHAVKGVFTVAF
jgi:hypothetical protein